MGIFGFVGDIVSDVLGGSSARSEQQKYNLQNMAVQQEYTKENMAIQNQYNIDAFNRENEYNTPLAQRQRAQAAGLNPNFDNTAGVVAQQDSGVTASSPSGGMPSAGAQGSISDLLSLVKIGKELKNLKADTKEKESNAEALKAKARKDNADASRQEFQADLDRDYASPERASGIRSLEAGSTLAEKNAEQVFSIAHATVSKLYAEKDYTEAQRQAVEESLPYIAKEIASRINANEASAYYQNMQGRYVPQFAAAATTSANASMVSAETSKIIAQNDAMRVNLEKMMTYADVALKGSQEQQNKIQSGLLGLSFQVEKQLYDMQLPQKERLSALHFVRSQRKKCDAEIREIDSRKDLNEQEKAYYRSSTIRNYVETLNSGLGTFDWLKPPGIAPILK